MEVVKSKLRCKVCIKGRRGECLCGGSVGDVPAIVLEVFLDEVILNKLGAVVRNCVTRRGEREKKGRYCPMLADGEG